MQNAVETASATVWMSEDGILRMVAHEGAVETEETAQETVQAMHAVSGGRRRPVLVDIRRGRSIDRGARMVYSGPDTVRFTTATAMLVDSPLSRMLGNFYLGLNRAPYPIRLFTSETEAVAWLGGYPVL